MPPIPSTDMVNFPANIRKTISSLAQYLYLIKTNNNYISFDNDNNIINGLPKVVLTNSKSRDISQRQQHAPANKVSLENNHMTSVVQL